MASLIASLAGVLIFLLSTPAAMNYIKIGEKQAKAAAAAQQMKAYDQAVAGYVQQYYSTIEAATPATITTSMLESTGFLPAGWDPVNAYGQSYQAYVTQPSAGNLETVVYTTGGRIIGRKTVPLVAGLVGQEGGYTSFGVTMPSGELVGAYGGWAVPYNSVLPAWPGPGHLADMLYFNVNGMLSPDYLYRVAVPGHPTLNQMQTNLSMGGNTASDASEVQGAKMIAGGYNDPPDSNTDLELHVTANSVGGLTMDDPWLGGAQTELLSRGGAAVVASNQNATYPYKATVSDTGDIWTYHSIVSDPHASFVSGSADVISAPSYDEGTMAVSTGMLYQVGEACLHAGEIGADSNGDLMDCVNSGGTLSWHYPSAHLVFYTQQPVAVGTVYPNATGYDEQVYVTSHACSGSIQNISLYISQSGATWYLVGHDVGYNGNDAGQVTTVVPAGWEWQIGDGGYCITSRTATIFELQ